MSNVIDLPSALLVKVPEGAYDFEIDSYPNGYAFLDYYIDRVPDGLELPNGNYGTPFLAKDATEEQANAVMLSAMRYASTLEEYTEAIMEGVMPKELLIKSVEGCNLNPSTTVVIPKK